MNYLKSIIKNSIHIVLCFNKVHLQVYITIVIKYNDDFMCKAGAVVLSESD